MPAAGSSRVIPQCHGKLVCRNNTLSEARKARIETEPVEPLGSGQTVRRSVRLMREFAQQARTPSVVCSVFRLLSLGRRLHTKRGQRKGAKLELNLVKGKSRKKQEKGKRKQEGGAPTRQPSFLGNWPCLWPGHILGRVKQAVATRRQTRWKVKIHGEYGDSSRARKSCSDEGHSQINNRLEKECTAWKRQRLNLPGTEGLVPDRQKEEDLIS